MSLRRMLLGLSAVAVAAVTNEGAAAPPQVSIVYGQVANFYQMDNHDPSHQGPVTSFTAGNGMFILYRIKKIDNNTTSSFAFHSSDVVTLGPSGNSDKDMPNQFPFAWHLGSVAVASGASVSFSGCIVKWVPSSNPQTLFHTNSLVDLKYPNAQITRSSIDGATKLLSVAWPELLNSLCVP
jgi:hypothetical protein